MSLFKDFFITVSFVFLTIVAWRVSEVASWYVINCIVERQKEKEESIEESIKEFFMDWGDDD